MTLLEKRTVLLGQKSHNFSELGFNIRQKIAIFQEERAYEPLILFFFFFSGKHFELLWI